MKRVLIAERKDWTLTRVFRPVGSSYTELAEKKLGGRVDHPVRYHDGHVVYDRPEVIPEAIRDWVKRHLDRYVKEHKGEV